MSEEVKKTPKKKAWKMKDEFFNKKKSILMKNNTVKEKDADFRKLVISGNHITLYKGQALTKDQLELFDKEAKEYWLTNA